MKLVSCLLVLLVLTLPAAVAQPSPGYRIERMKDNVYLVYLEALYAAVRDGMLAGKTLATLQEEIRLPEYRDLAMYEAWLPLNIAGVHRTLVEMSYFDHRRDIGADPRK